MTMIAAHMSLEALRERYVSSVDVCEARHFQTIWLLAKGHSVADVAEMTSFGRRRNGSTARVLKPDVLEKLQFRLIEPLGDAALWTSRKVAAFLARELGLEKVAVQRD